jgi:hypothetical protein
MTQSAPPWAWIAGWLVAGALLIRQAGLTGLPALQIVAAGTVAADVSLQHVLHFDNVGFPRTTTYVLAMLGLALLAQVVPFLGRNEVLRRSADHGAALAAAILSLSLVTSPMLHAAPMPVALGVPLLLGILILLATTRLGEGEWGLAAVLITAIVHTQWVFTHRELAGAGTAFLVMLLSATVFVAWPFAARRVAATRWIWWAAAAAGPLWFFPMRRTWLAWQGSGAIGLLAPDPRRPGARGRLRRAQDELDPRRGTAQRDRRPVGGGHLFCERRHRAPAREVVDHGRLGARRRSARVAVATARPPGAQVVRPRAPRAAAFRLVPTAVLLESYPRSGTPIVNWLLYTYLVPAAAMFAAAWMLAPEEAARARPAEKEIYAKGRPWGAIGASVAGIFTIFVWINSRSPTSTRTVPG